MMWWRRKADYDEVLEEAVNGLATQRDALAEELRQTQEQRDDLARALAGTRPHSGSCHVCGRCLRDEECRNSCMLAWATERVAVLDAAANE